MKAIIQRIFEAKTWIFKGIEVKDIFVKKKFAKKRYKSLNAKQGLLSSSILLKKKIAFVSYFGNFWLGENMAIKKGSWFPEGKHRPLQYRITDLTKNILIIFLVRTKNLAKKSEHLIDYGTQNSIVIKTKDYNLKKVFPRKSIKQTSP